MVTTIGKILVNRVLPEEFRDENRVLTKEETDRLLTQVARKYPDKYVEISHKLIKLGGDASFEEGTTLRLSDIFTPIQKEKQELIQHLKQQEERIKKSNASEKEKEEALEQLYAEVTAALKELTLKEGLARENPFALQVKSKARGNPDQLAALMTSPGVYQDSHDKTIPIFIEHSYAEGLKPHELWAATYGARKGVISSKMSTREAGYLGKLLSAAAIDQVVTEDDCGTASGIPVKVDDPDNIGAVLAKDAGGFKAGTVIDKTVLAKLAADKIDEIVIRSPITCSCRQGVCKHCVGLREDGKFPPIGYNIGVNAASAIAEQIAQASLNVKHSGKKAKGHTTYSGFNVIKNLATVPEFYPMSATVASTEGTVTKILKAPQGGYNVFINDQPHYVPEEMPVLVKEGDKVEPGDQLSEGIVNPADVVKLKGLGEGRRYFADRFTRAMRESTFNANRRNVEVLARSMINHVKINDDSDVDAGDYLPGDIVTYTSWLKSFKPRTTATKVPVKKAIDQYLEEPALHYSIGTKITPSVINTLEKHGITEVLTNKTPPSVQPTMLSVVDVPEYYDDWMARLNSSNLKRRLLEDVHRGSTSNVHSINPIPGLAKGTEFGQQKAKTFTY